MREKLYPQLIQVDPRKIQFNERNPRKHQGAEYLRLKESVKEIGVVQLPTVRRLAGGFFECIDGEGRIKVAQEAELEQIWVICYDISDDVEALTMLQAANVVRSFNYLSGCKGMANLHREGQTYESIARNLGVSSSTVKTDASVGYFSERTLTLIQQNLLQSSEEDREGKRTLLWSAHTFATLLPLRIQIKARGDTPSLDGLYDYTEVHRAVEKIISGEIVTHERLQLYVEQRRRELFEERFDKTLQLRLEEELTQTKQALDEAHAQHLQNVEVEMARRHETQVAQLQQQLDDLLKRYQAIVKEVARRPELIAKRETELQQKLQETEEERKNLQALQQQIQKEVQLTKQQLEQELKKQAETTLQEQRAAMEREQAQVRTALEEYYSKRDKERQLRAEKTIRQSVIHGTELLSQSQQWLLLLISPGMVKGLTWLHEPEMVGLLAQVKAVRETLEQAEEAILHGEVVAYSASTTEGSSPNEYHYDRSSSPQNMGS